MDKRWVFFGLLLLVVFAGCVLQPAETTTSNTETTTTLQDSAIKNTTTTTTTTNTSDPMVPVTNMCRGRCKETDNGDIYMRGTTVFQQPGNLKENEITDSCINSTTLSEYGCDGPMVSFEIIDCPRGCVDGACRYGYFITTPPSCFDSDGGINSTQKSATTVSVYGEGIPSTHRNQTDYCIDENTLREYACDCYGEYRQGCITQTIAFEDIECIGGCVDGACLRV